MTRRVRCGDGDRNYAVQAFIIEYDSGVRVIVHTANLIRIDFDNKTQGMWWQDFPRKVRTLLFANMRACCLSCMCSVGCDDAACVTVDGGIAADIHV